METNCPAHNYLWNIGENTANIEITEPGIYSVTVQDAYCQTADTVMLSLIEDLVGKETVIELPEDTAICEQFLPSPLIPISNYSEEFFLNNSTPASNFTINESGTYIINTFVEGCLFENTVTVEVEACESFTQMPNVFTPNGDNINDAFFPIGEFFVSKDLSINRWGN
ncbi:MAG: hypothetical protein ACI9XO_001714 [Paraglaciecola sp.]